MHRTIIPHRGSGRGRTVYHLLLDSSDGDRAPAAGVNRAPKLAEAAGSAAVQRVTVRSGAVDVRSIVDFGPTRVVEAPDGFPPCRRRSRHAVVL